MLPRRPCSSAASVEKEIGGSQLAASLDHTFLGGNEPVFRMESLSVKIQALQPKLLAQLNE